MLGDETIVDLPIKNLRPYPKRARNLSALRVVNLAESIRENGLIEPILVDKSRMIVLDGDHRVEAYRQLGRESIKARVVDLDVSD